MKRMCIELCVCLLLVIAPLSGCVPNRILIDLAPGAGEYAETAVLEDPGVGRSGAKVVQIDVEGLISHAPSPGMLLGRSNAVDSLVSRLRRAEEDPNVRAVILRINSPGGTVAASETIYGEIRRYREATGNPVVVSMGEVAASGGYYIALAGDHIIAQPASVTGSIGVLVQTFNFSRGMERIGISGEAVVSGKNKDIANPFEPPVEEHYEIIQHMTNQFYERFRSLVIERRPELDADAAYIGMITDGRVFTGMEAAELGIVDETGSLHDAFDRAKQLGDVEAARLVKYHAEGTSIQSAYSTSLDMPPARSATASGHDGMAIAVSPFGVRMSGFGGEPSESGFYYLWIAPTP